MPPLFITTVVIGTSARADVSMSSPDMPKAASPMRFRQNLSGRASFARWQKHNGCEIEEPGSDGCFEAKNCRRDVVLCMYEGGHTWPAKLTPDWKRFLENQRLSAPKKP